MRLTLRTMLAYLDDILEPADAEELGKKIESSEFANNLVHHIRDCTQRLRLDAPEVSGQGLALDSNTVAEYLDNTLAEERVPDFERVCLDSKIHLAEVAACHQILTLVLGEPADVSPATRDRVYQLVSTSTGDPAGGPPQPETLAASDANPGANSADAAEPAENSQTMDLPIEQPVGWKQPTGVRLWPLAATLVVAFLVACAAMAVWSGWSASTGGPRQTAVVNQTPQKPGTSAAVSENGTVESTDNGLSEPVPPENSLPVGPVPPPSEIRPQPEAPVAAPNPENEAAPETVRSTTTIAPDAPATEETPSTDLPATVEADDPVVAETQPTDPAPAVETETTVPAAAEVVDVGRYVSDQQVLARLDGEVYKRLPSEGILYSGDHLLALPAFRPRVQVGAGILISLFGPTEITLGTPTPSGVSRATVHFGRLQVSRGGTSSHEVLLTLGNQFGQLTLQDAQSRLAIEVRRYLSPGLNPEENDAQVVVQLKSIRGNAQWSIPQPDGEPVTHDIPEGMQFVFLDQQPGEVTTANARRSTPRQLLDEDAAEFLSGMINNPDRGDDLPVSLSLREQLHHRRIEVRALAARCLAALDQFDAVLDALNEQEFKSFWESHLDALQHAIARSPKTASRLRSEWERKRDEREAAQRYRVTWGYNAQQLQTIGAQQLVGYLEHPDMDLRVLSAMVLQQITGRTKGYHAYRLPQNSKTQSSINSWKRDLQQGRITYETLPSPMAIPQTRAAASSSSRKRTNRSGKRSR